MTKTKEELYEELEKKKDYVSHLLKCFRNKVEELDWRITTLKEEQLEIEKQEEEIEQLQKSMEAN